MPVTVPNKSVGVAARLEGDPFLADSIDVAALHADHERDGGAGLHGELQFASRVSEGRQIVFYVRRKGRSKPGWTGRRLKTDILATLIRALCGWNQRVLPDEKVTLNTQDKFPRILMCRRLGE